MANYYWLPQTDVGVNAGSTGIAPRDILRAVTSSKQRAKMPDDDKMQVYILINSYKTSLIDL